MNYLCAQGDGRWWQDHRVPGGLALSVNSVGHLVRSGRMHNAFELLSTDIGTEPIAAFRIDSLEKALEFAMRTINMASAAPSGKATSLLPLPGQEGLPKCPVELPVFLREKNFCTYWGGYHTDITLPREYFRPEVERPPEVHQHSLDFKYLFHRDVDNPDHESMGEGRRIRVGEAATGGAPSAPDKRHRGVERVVDIRQTELLREALGY